MMTIEMNDGKVPHSWKFYKWVLFITALGSFNPWFFWGIKSYWFSVLFVIISLFIMLISPKLFSYKKKVLWLFLYLNACLITTIYASFNLFLSILISALPVLFVILLKQDFKFKFFIFFTKAFCLLIGISVLGWIVHLLGITTPWIQAGFRTGDTTGSFNYVYENHFLFLVNITQVFDIILPRFSSVFLEPGYLGTILAVILYLNEYKFKGKVYTIPLLIALFFTFSLAGWILGIFGFVACKLEKSKRKVVILSSIVFILIGFRAIVINYNNGNNMINQSIFERLDFVKGDQIISGNNRSGKDTEEWFNNTFLHSDDVLLGDKTVSFENHFYGVDWRAFIIKYGFMGLFFYISYLFYPYYFNRKFDQFVLLILYLGIFAQTYHGIFWLIYPLLYITGTAYIQEKQNSDGK